VETGDLIDIYAVVSVYQPGFFWLSSQHQQHEFMQAYHDWLVGVKFHV